MSFFCEFESDVSSIELPKLFTYPFNYTPHPIAIKAAEELQSYIQYQIEPLHNFGLQGQSDGIGKMFGVLVIQNSQNKIGYLAAFSGKLGRKNDYEKFVPPVYDMLAPNEFYKDEEERINLISEKINALETDDKYLNLIQQLRDNNALSELEIKQLKEKKKLAKADRTTLRASLSNNSSPEEIEKINLQLDRESAALHYELKELTRKWKKNLEDLSLEIQKHEDAISSLKIRRKQTSIALQHRLFENYTFLNAKKETKSLHDIFPIHDGDLPPSGAGECAAPKLLHYAYQQNYKPLAMAEFWYGKSPLSEIKKHGFFYPSCKSKCFPILSHMLIGLDVAPNPLADNPNQIDNLDIVYEDDYLILINKPHDFLSVPGKSIQDSIFTRIQQRYPLLKEIMVIHRLDMSTSGLILFAKTKFAHKQLQIQFQLRTIKKKYRAILDGTLSNEKGEISLPLRVDIDNRPRQLVCFDYGKSSITHYEVIRRKDNRTWIFLYPLTGRTHQLRVHAAHELGLNIPILGDDLYGKRENRLYLHAESIRFFHPVFEKEMEFEKIADF